jgi:cell fate regulator YaaT (PSP1 superfamily)
MIEEIQDTETGSFIVRYGTMRLLGEFEARRQQSFQRGDEVIVRSDRGVEWGVILSSATEKTRQYLGSARSGGGRILRFVSEEDRQSRQESVEREKDTFHRAASMIAERQMQMQLVDIEQVFGGERIILYYLSEKRVDFRDLVKLMAREFNARIEMRQIGVRDEARLLADYGDCGKPVCCNTHLHEMPPVSMKMAKLQKATLDPNKISGRCGRLKCCLRYEYDTYEAHRRELPAVGAVVITKNGQGRVLSQELLARNLIVAYDDGRRVMTAESEVLTVVSRGGRSRNQPQEEDSENNDE